MIIDGLDTNQLLEYLRFQVQIIPQTPLLFSGTVRSNLDPFSEYSDESIWSASTSVYCKSIIEEIKGDSDG